MAWTDFLDNIDWGGVAKAAVPAAIGTWMTSSANSKAAQTMANANAAAAGQVQAGNAAAIAAMTQANQTAQGRYQAIAEQTAPANQYLRTVMADQSLTPAQQQRVSDTRQQTGQMLSNRVGGRSATAIATKAAQGLENSIYDANRSRSDNAAGTLAGQGISAINAQAGQDLTFGTNVARLNSGQGTDLARLTTDTGQNTANAGLNTAKTQATMVGDIANPRNDIMTALRSYIADDRKGSYGEKWKGGAAT